MNKRFDISEEKLREMYCTQNKKPSVISKDIGCANGLVSYYLKKYNITRKLKIKQIAGVRFGKLIATTFLELRDHNAVWRCTCDCGNAIETTATNLGYGRVRSCGCLRSDVAKTHALSKTRQYHIWQAMKTRCTNPHAINYSKYGGAGITYDPNWETFENFWMDMKGGYSDNLTIERVDNSKGYSKENCIWANYSTQNFNRKSWSKVKSQ